MKKVIIFFSVLLLGIFVLFTAMDYNGRYTSEKAFWKVNQRFQQVAADPKTIPDATYNEIYQQYQEFIKHYPDSSLVPSAEILSARILNLKKEHDKSLAYLEKAVKRYSNKPNIAVEVVAEIGRTYAQQHDWANLLKTYQRVQRDYPLTDMGIKTPILVAQFYKQQNQPTQSEKAYQDGLEYYKKIIAKHPNSITEYNALRLMAACYLALSRWSEAIEAFAEAFIKYAKPEFMNERQAQGLISSINTLSIAQLKNYDLPIKVYQDFIKRNPGHAFNPQLKKLIENINLLKEKNINIQLDKKP